MNTEPILDDVSREPTGHEIAVVDAISRARLFETAYAALYARLRQQGYSDEGLRRIVDEYRTKLKKDARAL